MTDAIRKAEQDVVEAVMGMHVLDLWLPFQVKKAASLLERARAASTATVDIPPADLNDIEAIYRHMDKIEEGLKGRIEALEAAAKPMTEDRVREIADEQIKKSLPALKEIFRVIAKDTAPPTCTGCADRIADSDYHSCVPSEPGSDEAVPQKMGRGAETLLPEQRVSGHSNAPFIARRGYVRDLIRAAESAARREALEEAIAAARAIHQPPCEHSCGACRGAKDIQTRLRALVDGGKKEAK